MYIINVKNNLNINRLLNFVFIFVSAAIATTIVGIQIRIEKQGMLANYILPTFFTFCLIAAEGVLVSKFLLKKFKSVVFVKYILFYTILLIIASFVTFTIVVSLYPNS